MPDKPPKGPKQAIDVNGRYFSDDPVRQQVFFEALEKYGTIQAAADAAVTSYHTIRRLRRKDPAFRRRFEEAQRRFDARLYKELSARSGLNSGEPRYEETYEHDEVTGRMILTKRVSKVSDRLLEIQLKQRMPDQFVERQQIDGTMQHQGVLVVGPPAAGYLPGSAQDGDHYIDADVVEDPSLDESEPAALPAKTQDTAEEWAQKYADARVPTAPRTADTPDD